MSKTELKKRSKKIRDYVIKEQVNIVNLAKHSTPTLNTSILSAKDTFQYWSAPKRSSIPSPRHKRTCCGIQDGQPTMRPGVTRFITWVIDSSHH